MAYDNSYTAVTGATYAASDYNTYQKANLTAIWVGTTAGDLDYYTSATAKSRLALVTGGVLYGGASAPAWLVKPSVTSFLRNTSGGSLSWETMFGLHAKAIGIYDAAEQDVTSTSYVDVTNATLDITTTKTCTIFMIATGRMGTDSSTRDGLAQPVINGSAPASDSGAARQGDVSAGIYPFTVLHYVAGVAAGTITCKIQGKLSSAGGHVYFGNGTIMLLAIEE